MLHLSCYNATRAGYYTLPVFVIHGGVRRDGGVETKDERIGCNTLRSGHMNHGNSSCLFTVPTYVNEH
jgi:hypothetical protein